MQLRGFAAAHTSVALAILSCVSACGPSTVPTDASDIVRMDAQPDAIVQDATEAAVPPSVRFELPEAGLPNPGQVPYPSDLYRSDPDGTLVDTLTSWQTLGLRNNAPLLADNLARQQGFGRSTGAFFRIDPDVVIDPATLPADGAASMRADATAFLIDIDPASPTPGARVPCVAQFAAPVHVLAVIPDDVIVEPKRLYAIVVTNGVRTTDGTPLQASPTFAAIRDGMPGARTGAAGTLYGSAVDRVAQLAAPGFDPHSIVGLAVYTTEPREAFLRVMRDDVVAGRYGPPSSFNADPAVAVPFSVVRFGATAHPGWTATLDEWLGAGASAPVRTRDGTQDLPGFEIAVMNRVPVGIPHDAIGAVTSGTFNAPRFVRPFMNTTSPDDGTIAIDPTGHAIVQDAAAQIPVTFVFPRAPAPASGYPVVIFGHSGLVHRWEMFGIANELARAGIVTVAIDRFGTGQRIPMLATETTSFFSGSYQGPDGLADVATPSSTTGESMFGNTNADAGRDSARQAVIEYVELLRMLQRADLDLGYVADQYGGVAPRLDASHVGFLGSGSSLIGVEYLNLEPSVNPHVQIAGAGAGTLTVGEIPLVDAFYPAVTALFGLPSPSVMPPDRFSVLLQTVESIVDATESAVIANDVREAAHVVPHDMLCISARQMELVSESATVTLARALGLPIISPAGFDGRGLPQVAAPVRGNAGTFAQGLLAMHPATNFALDLRHSQRAYAPGFPDESMPAMRFAQLPSPITVREPIVPLTRTVVHFFLTAWSGAAEIDVTGLQPVEDFDDDGWLDSDERAMGTDPWNPSSHPPGTGTAVRDLGF